MPAEDDPRAGFSLIELVVVVAIVATLTLGVGLSAARPGAGARTDMARFAAAWTDARDLALAEQGRRGLALLPGGLRAFRYGPEGWQAAGPLRPWQGPVTLIRAAPVAFGTPQIVFLADGRSSPFEAAFGAGRCTSDGWTGLTCGF